MTRTLRFAAAGAGSRRRHRHRPVRHGRRQPAEGRAGAVRDAWRSCPARRESTSTTRRSCASPASRTSCWPESCWPTAGTRRWPTGSSTRSRSSPTARSILVGVIDISCTPAETAGLVRLDDGHLAMYRPWPRARADRVLRRQHDSRRVGRRRRRRAAGFGGRRRTRPFRVRRVRQSGHRDGRRAHRRRRRPDRRYFPPTPTCPSCRRRRRTPVDWRSSGLAAQFASAELWVTATEILPRFVQEDPDALVMCDTAEYYLAVFDLPNDQAPPDAELAGSNVR